MSVERYRCGAAHCMHSWHDTVRASDYDALEARICEALELIERFGGIDGGHHKTWVIDQVARCLVPNYAKWVIEMKAGEDGPETYTWDEGIPP